MQLHRYQGKNHRDLMTRIKTELGDDAVVITTRNLRGGEMEILAASSHDIPADPAEPIETESKPSFQNRFLGSTTDLISSRAEAALLSIDKRITSLAPKEADSISRPLTLDKNESGEPPNPATPSGLYSEQVRMLNECLEIKSLLRSQMDMLTWRDNVIKNPTKVEVWDLLRKSGFSPLFARTVVEKIPENMTSEGSIDWVKKVLLKNIPVVEAGKDMVATGGVFALVGPTGVGKTTTTAKIAANCIIKYGKESVGLITTDSYRIGAVDQLRIFGKILGVQVFTAQTLEDLKTLQQTLQRKRLVLIDTAGMAQRDEKVSSQSKMLSETDAKRILLLNAASQPETLDDVALHYKLGGLSGCILSKLDEAVRLGGALDVVIRHKLPIHYLATGQQVPADLYRCKSEVLAKRALNSKASSAFEISDTEREWMGVLSHRERA